MTFETTIIALGFFAFCGGLIDAAVGGIPALLHALPQHNIATVFGTNKLAVWAGTVSSFTRYVHKINFVWKLLIPTMLSAFLFAFIGAMLIAHIPKQLMTYSVLFLLIIMAIYTFIKKDLGAQSLYQMRPKRGLPWSFIWWSHWMGSLDPVAAASYFSFL